MLSTYTGHKVAVEPTPRTRSTAPPNALVLVELCGSGAVPVLNTRV